MTNFYLWRLQTKTLEAKIQRIITWMRRVREIVSALAWLCVTRPTQFMTVKTADYKNPV